jgi:hypothetical protein
MSLPAPTIPPVTPGPYPTGRLPATDLQDHNYLAGRLLSPRAIEKPTRTHHEWTWPKGVPPLNQGNEPACTGFSSVGMVVAGPVYQRNGVAVPTGMEIYKQAQTLDEWEGENYEGSSVRGAMKALQVRGYISEYSWAFSTDVASAWLLAKGPMVFGTIWVDSMFTPIDHAYRGKGYKFLRVDRTQMPSGGGHAYLVRGCNLNMRTPGGGKGAYLIQNSWGPWGADGTAWIAIDDMAALMHEDGEACTPTEVRMGGPEKDRPEDVVE